MMAAPGRGRIESAFARAKGESRAAFIPYITAGDPDPGATVAVCRALAEEGADIIELGVPFSDPVADGEVIQRACERSLSKGMSLSRALDLAVEIGNHLVPVVLMSYVNPILAMGIGRFADRCRDSGVDGVLATDLPLEESGELRQALAGRSIRLVTLLAPTSGEERARKAGRVAGGFIYYISRTGVTGERTDAPSGLPSEIAAVRREAGLPVAVGFGISSAEQYRQVAAIADGVVVGSAIVRAIEEGGTDPAGAARRAVRKMLGKE